MAKGLRAQIFAKEMDEASTVAAKPVVTTATTVKYSGKTRKIQVRVAEENYKWMESEAKRTASNISAVAGTILADGIDIRRQQGKIVDDEELHDAVREALRTMADGASKGIRRREDESKRLEAKK